MFSEDYSFLSYISCNTFYSFSTLISEFSYLAVYTFGILVIYSKMNTTPIIGSLHRGPELVAMLNPKIIEFRISFTEHLYSARSYKTSYFKVKAFSS